MRLKKITVGVLATGGLLFAIPAAAFAAGTASAATATTSATSSGTASFSQFQQVAVGQTVQQVEQEMGSAQPHGGLAHQLPGSNDFSESWTSSSLLGQLGLEKFFVDFSAQGTATPIADAKGTEPINLTGLGL